MEGRRRRARLRRLPGGGGGGPRRTGAPPRPRGRRGGRRRPRGAMWHARAPRARDPPRRRGRRVRHRRGDDARARGRGRHRAWRGAGAPRPRPRRRRRPRRRAGAGLVTGAPAPLDGVRVLDLSRLLPGGFCSLLLADFGADVVKVEDTWMGDYVRWAPPAFEGADDTAKGALFLALNRGKRSVRLDLKTEGGREALLRLARDADVLLESFRPGVLDRLGVGWDVLHEVNPGLVYCAITGYGQTGPLRARSGHDLNYLGLNGLLALTGDADGPPVQAGGQIADLGGGALMAAFGILAALRHRDRTGQGQLVDVSMFDGALAWLGMVAARVFAAGDRPRRGHEQLGGSLLCYRPYRCADGWVTLGALEPKFWRAWCAGVGRDDLVERQFEAPGSAAHAEVEAVFAGRTRAEWEGFAAEHDCCLEPVLELEEALDSELVRAREMVLSFEQPGAGAVRGLGFPVKLSATPGAVRRGGPALGEHTREVLAAAGYDDDGLDRLQAEGAIAGAADDAAEPSGPPRSFLA